MPSLILPSPKERKPHLLKVKQAIVTIIDGEIASLKRNLQFNETHIDGPDNELRRDIAIWIKQRNRLAKDADLPEIEIKSKDGQGKLIYQE